MPSSIRVLVLLVLGRLVTVIWDCVLQPWLSFLHRFDNITGSLTSCSSALALQHHDHLGGGPVVILLRDYVLKPGWISPRDFLLWLVIIQAMPEPSFNLAVCLGAMTVAGPASSYSIPTLIGAILTSLGIFSPGLWISVGFQSIWRSLRKDREVTCLLRDIDATTVGFIFTAVYRIWVLYCLGQQNQFRTRRVMASGGCLHIFLRRMVLRPASDGYLSQGHCRSCLVGCSEALVLSELIPSIIEPMPLLSTQAQVEPDWNSNYLLANSRATNKDIGTRRTLALPTAKAADPALPHTDFPKKETECT